MLRVNGVNDITPTKWWKGQWSISYHNILNFSVYNQLYPTSSDIYYCMQIWKHTNINNRIFRENFISKELTTRPPFVYSYVCSYGY